YSFAGLANGTYTVTPSKSGFTFTPTNQPVTISGANQTGINFAAQTVTTASISGMISPSSFGSGAVLVLSGAPSAYAIADGSGRYSFTNLPSGSYTITPRKTGYTFSPQNWVVPLTGAGATGINFTAQALSRPPLNYPDLTSIIPPGQISVVGTGSSRQFQYT